MWAVIEFKNSQYYVKEGKKIDLPLLKGVKEGEEVLIDKVLLLKENGNLRIGYPYLPNVRVKARVTNPLKKLKKIIVFKMKPKKNYRRKKGHRQKVTEAIIEKIEII
ncbi:MAG: 50S ribosomal protein L21 [Candidatus Hydrothermales bacterium]